ncbi:metal ABC transporter ATP-binding protein [Paenibacillus hexagrammi]|uniref:Metal ABC transporter ATP-binding protein n=1 Tax=Paenibacillus hexagrammi TaxID=2908839 RepID=A0ABY3SQM9_9BACL|nr:metal ABC transporter ATP-binding protein [Paenibacillus sp. YPD9-1]UJF36318.1 metal ABC transporter ATP-binding protein [Paenibacillus sp. YPD9-1]
MMIVSMQDVQFGYSDVPCLQDVNVDIMSGEFVAITGPNGAAKTTLLKLMLRLLQPWKGSVQLTGKGMQRGRPVIGYVPQQIAAFNSGFPSKVLEFVRSGRHSSGSWFRRMNRDDEQRTETALRQVGMWELRHRRIGELSGGQKQRICLARAIAQEPDLLVLDEPTTGMDMESRSSFYRLMTHLVRSSGMTVVMVTHSLEEVRPLLDRIIQLERKEHGGWKCCTTTSCSGHFVPVE